MRAEQAESHSREIERLYLLEFEGVDELAVRMIGSLIGALIIWLFTGWNSAWFWIVSYAALQFAYLTFLRSRRAVARASDVRIAQIMFPLVLASYIWMPIRMIASQDDTLSVSGFCILACVIIYIVRRSEQYLAMTLIEIGVLSTGLLIGMVTIFLRDEDLVGRLGLLFATSTLVLYLLQGAFIVRRQRLRADEAAERTRYTVTHDSLTGVASHLAFTNFIQQALELGSKTGHCIGLLRIDLDHFKNINDTFGHAAGDAVLVRVGQILHANAQNEELVARLGGDEFAVVVPKIESLPELQVVAENLRRQLSSPFFWEGRNLRYTVSIGGALSELGTQSPEQLLRHSDFALYEVKRNGRNKCTTFDQKLHARHGRHQRYLGDLAECIRNDQLEFKFQPVLSTTTGEIAGLETLVRWNHPTDGPINTDELLNFAAELGLLANLDKAAARAAFQMKQSLIQMGHVDVRMGFNVSMEALNEESYVNFIIDTIVEKRFEPDHFVLELLETVILNGRSTRTIASIERLAHFGLDILLDDFGVGFAGLAHLSKLPITGVKVDKTLIRELKSDQRSSLIVSALIDLCQKLGLSVVAEGVEELETAVMVAQYGGKFVQGFWFYRPMTADEVMNAIHLHQPKRVLLQLRSATPTY